MERQVIIVGMITVIMSCVFGVLINIWEIWIEMFLEQEEYFAE